MKHLVKCFKSITNGDMSADITGESLKCFLCDYAIVHLKWTGTARGKIVFDVSLSDEKKDIEFYTLDDVEYAITTDSGEVELNLHDLCHGLLRPRFVRTSGTGTLTAKINGKSIGG